MDGWTLTTLTRTSYTQTHRHTVTFPSFFVRINLVQERDQCLWNMMMFSHSFDSTSICCLVRFDSSVDMCSGRNIVFFWMLHHAYPVFYYLKTIRSYHWCESTSCSVHILPIDGHFSSSNQLVTLTVSLSLNGQHVFRLIFADAKCVMVLDCDNNRKKKNGNGHRIS